MTNTQSFFLTLLLVGPLAAYFVVIEPANIRTTKAKRATETSSSSSHATGIREMADTAPTARTVTAPAEGPKDPERDSAPATAQAGKHDLAKEPMVAGETLKPSELPPPIRGQDYKLVFHDEFDGPPGTKADKSRWSDWDLGKRKKAFNVADACKLNGEGHLVIEVRRGQDGRIETGGIDSRRQFQATHGYFECRAKLLEQPGAWCAFWIQTPSIGRPLGDGATAGVEIDVFEYFPYAWKRGGSRRDLVEHNAHWDGYAKEVHKSDHAEKYTPNLAMGFHTFAVKWDEAGYVFFVDNIESGRWQKAPVSKRPQFLILSCEADTWTGDIAKAQLPATFVVDHVRAWQTPVQIAADAQRSDAKRPAMNP